MLVEDSEFGLYSTASPVARTALAQMDAWLTALAADVSDDSVIEKVVRAKPTDLVDACWSRGDKPEKISESMERGRGRCEELFPSPPAPREVAGGSIGSDILKCELKSIDPADYHVALTAAQITRLKRVFSTGVCDWSQPGVEQTKPLGTWLQFSAT